MELHHIESYLDNIGIPRHLTGYGYLVDALDLAIDNPNVFYRGAMSQLYMKMYQKNGIKPENAERNMRYAIETIFSEENSINAESLSRIFGEWYYIGHMSLLTFLVLSKRELLACSQDIHRI